MTGVDPEANELGDRLQGTVVVDGEAEGPVIALARLSLWGGFDPATGRVIDEHHPQTGARLTAAIVVMESGRGSSSASSVLLEAARLGTLPAGFIVRFGDEILSTGAIVADELYGTSLPIVALNERDYGRAVSASWVSIARNGTVDLLDAPQS